nr:unnamed protein product [Callosobruchus analis]
MKVHFGSIASVWRRPYHRSGRYRPAPVSTSFEVMNSLE